MASTKVTNVAPSLDGTHVDISYDVVDDKGKILVSGKMTAGSTARPEDIEALLADRAATMSGLQALTGSTIPGKAKT